jgi:hypothetical protein
LLYYCSLSNSPPSSCNSLFFHLRRALAIPVLSGADNSLARPGRKQARKHVRDARDFNSIEAQAVIKFFWLQGKAPEEIHAILTKTLACFLPGWDKELSAPLYLSFLNYVSRVVWS